MSDSVDSVESSSGAAAALGQAEELREALRDMLAGWQYIRRTHGDLYGVGWDRAELKALAALGAASTIPPAAALGCIPVGWQLESGQSGFSDDCWVTIRHLESQCGQDFYESNDRLIFSFLSALQFESICRRAADGLGHVGLSFESELLLAQAALGICYPLAQDHGAPGHRDLVDRAQVAMARALDRIRSAS